MFCDNKIMLLWVKTQILIFLDLRGRGDKSSTVTTRHVTSSQNWVENKPKTLLWRSEAKNQWKVWFRIFDRKRKDIFSSFVRFSILEIHYTQLNQSLWASASPYFDSVCFRQCRRRFDTHTLIIDFNHHDQ